LGHVVEKIANVPWSTSDLAQSCFRNQDDELTGPDSVEKPAAWFGELVVEYATENRCVNVNA